MVAEGLYQEWLAKSSKPEARDVPSCSGFLARELADTRGNNKRGLAVTGVAGGICTRHEFVLPNSMVDLQKGEKYKVSLSTILHQLSIDCLQVLQYRFRYSIFYSAPASSTRQQLPLSTARSCV